MIQIEDFAIQSLAVHYVGNKLNDEVCAISKGLLNTNEKTLYALVKYFRSSFKSQEYYNFFHESDINLNETYTFAGKIFENPDALYEQSTNLAQHLYAQCVHPKIKSGEFYVVYLKDCMLDDHVADAIGLFKSENKDTFLQVSTTDEGLNVESETGININKPDKGCLIFNMEKDKGYVVAVVDNTNKGLEAQYWIDSFLKIRQRNDEYLKTQQVMTLCKDFITKELPQQYNTTKADQVDMLKKSVKFFKEKENFEMEEFTNEVIGQADVIETFNNYKTNYQTEQEIQIDNNFNINNTAVKKQERKFKSVIKLDKNFHIYVHGNPNLIEQGVDENGRKFYKIFYQDEN